MTKIFYYHILGIDGFLADGDMFSVQKFVLNLLVHIWQSKYLGRGQSLG